MLRQNTIGQTAGLSLSELDAWWDNLKANDPLLQSIPSGFAPGAIPFTDLDGTLRESADLQYIRNDQFSIGADLGSRAIVNIGNTILNGLNSGSAFFGRNNISATGGVSHTIYGVNNNMSAHNIGAGGTHTVFGSNNSLSTPSGYSLFYGTGINLGGNRMGYGRNINSTGGGFRGRDRLYLGQDIGEAFIGNSTDDSNINSIFLGMGEVTLHLRTRNATLIHGNNIILGNNARDAEIDNAGDNVFNIVNGNTTPNFTAKNGFAIHSANVAGVGTAAPHFLTEAGDLIKLYRAGTIDLAAGINNTTVINQIRDILQNLGFAL